MGTKENGNLGLNKKAIQKILDTAVANIDLKSGLTDGQVVWVKNKVATVEVWKDIAITKFAELETRISAIETKAVSIQTRLTNIEARLTAHHI